MRRLLLLGLLCASASGCLSNSYTVKKEELSRLAATPPETRWEKVRATQRIFGDDTPPEDTSTTSYDTGGGGPAVGVIIVGPPPPLILPPVPPGVPGPHIAPPPPHHHASGGHGSHSGAGGPLAAVSKASSGGGNAKSESAVLILAAVAVGAGVTVGAAFSEGSRYDGWITVHPDEPIFIETESGHQRVVPMSMLSAEYVQDADSAIIYEGEEGRFPRQGRAPLNRNGFNLTAAFHAGGIPQLNRTQGLGMGGYFHIGGNIMNYVTLGMAATADGGVSVSDSTLFATLAPEIHVYPIKYVGVYGGGGLAWRNTDLPGGTRADRDWFYRFGLVGEIPLTTRLALQARGGAARYLYDGYMPFTWEGQFGIAVY